jgi:tetratricopeptide (TPR) repeat protein
VDRAGAQGRPGVSNGARCPKFGRAEVRAGRSAEVEILKAAALLWIVFVSAQAQTAEEWGRLGASLYERDDYAGAARAFERAAAANPRGGNAAAMLGLCEYQLGRFDSALDRLRQARQLGVSGDAQFLNVLTYTEGMLLLHRGEFETARETLGRLSRNGVNSPELIRALGLAALRVRPQHARQGGQAAMLARVGRAEHLAAQNDFASALREYERLTSEFPKVRNLHYARGRVLLLARQDEQALPAFERELENSPDHVLARLGIANAKLATDPAAGLPFAQEAVKLQPQLPLARYLLGMLLLETGEAARAVEELETARRLDPDEPAVPFALARAYTAAGRSAEAERARADFVRLKKTAASAPP